MNGVVLAYHRVASVPDDPWSLAVPPETFRAHLSWIRAHCLPVDLASLFDALPAAGRPPVAITLDDGYVDNYTAASPILCDLDLPATFFVTTENLFEPSYEYWWDRLARASIDDCRALHRAILHARAEDRDVLLSQIPHAGDQAAGPDTHRRMRADEIRELASRPRHSVGAHTDRHLFLPAQTAETQRAEVFQSIEALERLLGRAPDTLAYPFGADTVEAAAAARSKHVRVAVTTREALVDEHTDPLRTPRFEVTPDRAAQFAEWMHGVLDGQ